MATPRKKSESRTERRQINQVTGDLEVTRLDAVQRAFEVVWRLFESQLRQLPHRGQHDELIDRLTLRMLQYRPGGYTDSENTREGHLEKMLIRFVEDYEKKS